MKRTRNLPDIRRCKVLIEKGRVDEAVLKRERVITKKRYANARRY